jgi:hypothetical protein
VFHRQNSPRPCGHIRRRFPGSHNAHWPSIPPKFPKVCSPVFFARRQVRAGRLIVPTVCRSVCSVCAKRRVKASANHRDIQCMTVKKTIQKQLPIRDAMSAPRTGIKSSVCAAVGRFVTSIW